MGVRVKDPQQNKHRWWGTLSNDKSAAPYIENAGKECIFIKTSKQAHYIMQGTCIKDWNILSANGDTEEALKNITNVSMAIKDRIKADISAKDFPKKMTIVEILMIDDINTTPLTKKMNALTRELFTKGKWTKKEAEEVGKEDIELGFKIKSKPKPKSKNTA